jgi:hypothetical protein
VFDPRDADEASARERFGSAGRGLPRSARHRRRHLELSVRAGSEHHRFGSALDRSRGGNVLHANGVLPRRARRRAGRVRGGVRARGRAAVRDGVARLVRCRAQAGRDPRFTVRPLPARSALALAPRGARRRSRARHLQSPRSRGDGSLLRSPFRARPRRSRPERGRGRTDARAPRRASTWSCSPATCRSSRATSWNGWAHR